jgi:anti-sigma B factor antagonist
VADIDVSSSRCAGYVLVALRGELDVCDAPRLARALSAVAAPGSPVIEDLAGLTLTDCSGLGALVCARKQALQAGGELLLAAPERPVLRLLSLIGLIDWLPVFATVEEASSGDGRPPSPGWPAGEQADGQTSAWNGGAAPARDDTSAVRSR